MPRKRYKVGDRVFFKCYDGSIGTRIVLDINDRYYIDDKGNKVCYQCLITGKGESIEDYSCLPKSDPEVKALAKELTQIDKILESINDLLSPYSDMVKKAVIQYLNNKFDIE